MGENQVEDLINLIANKDELIELLLDAKYNIIFLTDTKGHLLYANSTFLDLIGLSPKEIKMRNLMEFYSGGDSRKISRVMEKLKKKEEVKNLEIEAEISGGEIRYYNLNISPLTNKNGETILLSEARDITELKKGELSMMKFKTLFLKSPIGIELFDSKGKNLIVNKACLDIFGITNPKRIQNLGLFSSPFISEDAKKKIKKGKTVRMEIPYDFNKVKRMDRYDTVKHEFSYLEVLIAPIVVSSSQEVSNYLVYIQDITDRKEMEQKLKSSLSRSEFYRDLLAHDIGNILNNIKSSTHLLEIWKDTPHKSKRKEKLIELIKRQVERGASLISSVHKLSELEVHQQARGSVNIKNLFDEAIEAVNSQFNQKDIKIQSKFPKEDIYVEGGELLTEAFENILRNGIIHNTNNKIELKGNVSKEKEEERDFVKIEIEDNGIGIPNGIKENIFKRDYKSDRSTGGMGIGLSLVRKIINIYGGKVWVENKVEEDFTQGSRFIIHLKEA